MAYSEASSPSKERSSKKKLDRITITPGKNKGHVVEHHYRTESGDLYMHRPEVYPFSDGHEMMKHLSKHLKVGLGEAKAVANAEDEHEGENVTEPGGKPDHEVADKEPKEKEPKKSNKTEKGED